MRNEQEQNRTVTLEFQGEFPKINNSDYAQAQQQVEDYMYQDLEIEVDILVLAYNQLEERTKICLQSLAKYTKDIKYHLLLLDNGSTDETLSYFEQFDHTPKTVLHVERNTTPTFLESLIQPYCRGRYLVRMGNDVIVTPRWIDSMLEVMKTNPRCGIAFPCITNTAMAQAPAIPALFHMTSLEELEEIAEQFNRRNPLLWEERMVTLPSLCMIRRSCLERIGGLFDPAIVAYADIDLSVRVRRAGYQLIICQDTMVHHNHPFTEESHSDDCWESDIDKKLLQKNHGIHPWDDYVNFEFPLLAALPDAEREGPLRLLGVEVKCGTALLELANKVRAKGREVASLYAFSTQAKYCAELATICEDRIASGRIDTLARQLEQEQFDYILLGEEIDLFDQPVELLQSLCQLLSPGGVLLFKLNNCNSFVPFLNAWGYQLKGMDTRPRRLLTLEQTLHCLDLMGMRSVDIEQVGWDQSEELRGLVRKFTETAGLSEDVDFTMDLAFTGQYLLYVRR